MEILTHFLYQLLFTVGVVVVFGLIIAFCRRTFCRLLGRTGPKILLATGIVGTPIHELSHALMCIVFGHKINEIKLYQPTSDDGTLGYVSHSYNKRNIYHQIGNFFIGIAPILGGAGVIMLLLYFLMPYTFYTMGGHLAELSTMPLAVFNFSTVTKYAAEMWAMVMCIFDFSQAQNTFFWIFIILALMISSHMELSTADIKGGTKGFLLLSVLLLLADTVLYFFFYPVLWTVTQAMISFSSVIVSLLTVAGIFSVALLLIAGVLRLVGGVTGLIK